MPAPVPGVPPPRPGGIVALLALPAAAVCGFGLGALALSMLPVAGLPPPAIEPPISAVPASAPPGRAPEGAAPAPWPAAFGLPPEPPPLILDEPEPFAAEPDEDHGFDDPPDIPPPDARLRGLALDDNGGWALVEIDGAVLLVTPGSALDDYHTVTAILVDAILIESETGLSRLGFVEEDPAPGARMRNRIGRDPYGDDDLEADELLAEEGFDDLPEMSDDPDHDPDAGDYGLDEDPDSLDADPQPGRRVADRRDFRPSTARERAGRPAAPTTGGPPVNYWPGPSLSGPSGP